MSIRIFSVSQILSSSATSHIPVIDAAIDATPCVCVAAITRQQSSFRHSRFFSKKRAPPATHPPFVCSEPVERSPKIRAQTAEIPKDPSSTLRRCRWLGVAGQGRRQRDVGGGAEG